MIKRFLVMLLLFFLTLTITAQKTILYCGKLIDVTNSKVLSNYSIIIGDNNIIDIKEVFTAGKAIATTGGHADPTNGFRKDLMGDPGPEAGVANGPDECRKAVRQRYKDGADLIKITASGGVLSVAKSGENPQFSEEEIRAIVITAKDYGFKVAAHC